MEMISGRIGRLREAARAARRGVCRPDSAPRLAGVLAACLALTVTSDGALASEPTSPGPDRKLDRFPTVPVEHKHVRALLENAMHFVAPRHKMVDPVSGYPFEGWNHDPKRGLFLRSFTQLTAIGLYMELLANVVSGSADSPDFTREQAMAQLTRLVESLRHDQRDPSLAAKGLLVNFLDLGTGKRLGPLTGDVEKQTLVDSFGRERGEALWKALQAKGWIVPRNDGREAGIVRSAGYGAAFFDGPLAPFRDEPTKRKVMEILDRRVLMIVFGDNANLSASAAKTIGALLVPEVASKPGVEKLRRELEQYLNDQREGYAHLYDPEAGLFNFGWDATKNRLFGWENLDGKWVTGHMDYFVNEFRSPAIFVAARFGLPREAIGNLGFKEKPYRLRDGRETYILAPWDGSAFQAMGLGLSLGELESPGWRQLLGNVVDVEIDYSSRHKLPGFLSESYTGNGVEYTGNVGIPEIAVSPKPRITDAASLYCLGVAYTIAPKKVERFVGENWPVISSLLTDHGPWEGFNVTKKEIIQFQTSTHTLSLILGFLGTGSTHMKRYAEQNGFGERLGEFMKPGENVDLLSDEIRSFAWADKEGGVQSLREGRTLRVKGDRVNRLGIAFVASRETGVNLSGAVLRLRYRSSGAIEPVVIALKPVGNTQATAGLIPKEIFTRFVDTGGKDEEIEVPLPAMIGLSQIKEVVITHERGIGPRPIDVTLTRFEFPPAATATLEGRAPR
jgi:hypothetical protein